QRHVGEVGIGEGNVQEPAQGHVKQVAGRVGLVLRHVELAQGKGELYGVPVVEHARAVRPARKEGEGGEPAHHPEITPAREVPPHRAGHAYEPAQDCPHTRSAAPKIPEESPRPARAIRTSRERTVACVRTLCSSVWARLGTVVMMPPPSTRSSGFRSVT